LSIISKKSANGTEKKANFSSVGIALSSCPIPSFQNWNLKQNRKNKSS
jgi:hypothetical protein